jgi:hypothetical protein
MDQMEGLDLKVQLVLQDQMEDLDQQVDLVQLDLPE